MLRAVHEREPRVDGLLTGQLSALVDAVDERLAQHSISITLAG
jgi:hypothetical protein